jgi:cytochrome d ubiquinol oxidase subunit II
MLAVYVLLDGFDIGAGAMYPLLARSEEERRMVLAAIGPVWNANEVWLIAAGGTMFFAFPALYASSFSGFYLPLMIVLWLLILRGTSLEFRGHIRSQVWHPLWDFVFCASSLLLAIFYGAALGNVTRGVPLDATGYFLEPLWTDFRVGPHTGILDWYTIPAGLLALAALALHGSLWIACKTEGPLASRARRLASRIWWPTVVLLFLLTFLTWRVQPQFTANFSRWPAGFLLPALAVGALIAVSFALRRANDRRAFLCSSVYLAAMLGSVAFSLYPLVLPARSPEFSLTIANTRTGLYGLRIGLIWWALGILLAAGYFFYLYKSLRGKVSLDSDAGHYGG